MIDLSNPVDYVELQEVIDRKELFDNLLQEIIQEREVSNTSSIFRFVIWLLVATITRRNYSNSK
jgi:hypothetical protein